MIRTDVRLREAINCSRGKISGTAKGTHWNSEAATSAKKQSADGNTDLQCESAAQVRNHSPLTGQGSRNSHARVESSGART